jgi:DNA-binding YbaB/EbfC family protein
MQHPGKLVKALAAMQQNVERIQTELAQSQFEGSAGGGLVRITLTGKGEAVQAFIDPAVLEEDAETAAELVVAAINAANAEKERVSRAKLAGIAGGLLPAAMRLPGT